STSGLATDILAHAGAAAAGFKPATVINSSDEQPLFRRSQCDVPQDVFKEAYAPRENHCHNNARLNHSGIAPRISDKPTACRKTRRAIPVASRFRLSKPTRPTERLCSSRSSNP